MNLSLIIDDVRRSDSIQDYHCDLEVADPRTGSTYSYDVASNVNISLTVLCKLVTRVCVLYATVDLGWSIYL